MTAPIHARRLANTALLICDMQEAFRKAIYRFDAVVSTSQKMLSAAQVLDIPVFATTQNAARLGQTVEELDISRAKVVIDKKAFSMALPEIMSSLDGVPTSVAIVGIEAHVCVLQTTIDLLQAGHHVYLITDGISSCNPAEIGVALSRCKAMGARITTSESFLYEVMGTAAIREFAGIIKVVKESKEATQAALEALVSSSKI